MHGIERTKKLQEGLPQSSRISRIIFRYSDGRTLTFIPEAGREDFSEDDMHELVKAPGEVFSTAERSEVGHISVLGG